MSTRHVRVAVLATTLLLLTGCGDNPDVTATQSATTQQAAPTVAPSEESPAPPPTPEPSEPEVETTFGGSDGGAGTQPSETGAPQTVSTALTDTPLGLSDVFAVVGEWEENRYEVADRSDVAGMGVSVQTCYDDQNTPQLEYRLANRFSKLRFTVSQSNASLNSDRMLAVVVLGNEEQRDIQKVPFNQVKPIELDITGVNALKVRFYVEEGENGCRSDTEVTAVVEDLRVS